MLHVGARDRFTFRIREEEAREIVFKRVGGESVGRPAGERVPNCVREREMGSDGRVAKRAVMICGDYMEDYEAMVPFQVLQAMGVRVDAVSPNKKTGQKCATAVHEYMGYEVYPRPFLFTEINET